MKPAIVLLFPALAAAILCGCAKGGPVPSSLDGLADDYVRLVLAAGRHDPNYVDAYYGPKEWKEAAEKGDPRPLPELLGEARGLLARVKAQAPSDRRDALVKELVAVEAFLRLRLGERMRLDEEARLLYDIEPPVHGVADFEPALARLDALLPGEGSLAARYESFRNRFIVPGDRLPEVVKACLSEVRRKTARLIALPPGESFRVAFVTGKPWGAYNWYQGGYTSRIEFNRDLPIDLARVLATVAHEGYPGHHVYNCLLEEKLVRGLGFREFTVAPLYSPGSVISEGTADVGIDIIMTPAERLAFLGGTLAPLAGLVGLDLETYEKVRMAREPLRYARGEAARMLLDEGRPESEVVAFLIRYGIMEEARARKAVDFARTYRSYEFCYTAGEDLVRAYLGTGSDRTERFFDVLERPCTPTWLREHTGPGKKAE